MRPDLAYVPVLGIEPCTVVLASRSGGASPLLDELRVLLIAGKGAAPGKSAALVGEGAAPGKRAALAGEGAAPGKSSALAFEGVAHPGEGSALAEERPAQRR